MRPRRRISEAEVAKQFVNTWVFNNDPPSELVADNGGCFISKFFVYVCRIMSFRNKFTTTYHTAMQRQGQTLQPYNLGSTTNVCGRQRNWDALTYAYSCQPHTWTNVAPFKLVLSKTTGALAANPMPSKEEPRGDFKHKWKHSLQDMMLKTTERLAKHKQGTRTTMTHAYGSIQSYPRILLRIPSRWTERTE